MTKTLSKEEIRAMDQDKLNEQILAIKKILFEFRMKQTTKQSFKPHMLKVYKRQLAQIMTIQHEKFK